MSELNAQVRVELEKRFASVWVEGEIVNFVAHGSGHWYFTLHDAATQVKAACYRSSNWRIRFKPFDGLQVRIRGRLSLYEPRGEYQLLVESLEPIGEGALRVAFEQIKAKLGAEGLFADSLKRPLPFFPRRIGIVTSPTGAAYFDILNVVMRRTRSVSIVLIPTRVQGENAGEEIRRGILFANEFNRTSADKIDVLIVGRGGGSSEDLWAFNEERLARTIRESAIPIISAVGHEVDITIADLVADLRAATPSAAAELVAEREDYFHTFVDSRSRDLEKLMSYKMLSCRHDLQELAMSPVFVEFPGGVKDRIAELDDIGGRMNAALAEKMKTAARRLDGIVPQLSPAKLASKLGARRTRLALLESEHAAAMRNRLRAKEESLKVSMASLDALSPLAVLKRGFSITENEKGEIVRDSARMKQGDKLRIRLANGKLKAEVTETE